MTATYTAPATVPASARGVAAIGAGGGQIAFFRYDSAYALYVMNADGTGLTRFTEVRSRSYLEGPFWSPDGTEIAFVSNHPDA
jgi:WD40 repeat protein